MDSRPVRHTKTLRSIIEHRTDVLFLVEMIKERAVQRATPEMDHCRDLLLCKRNARSVYMRKLCPDTMYSTPQQINCTYLQHAASIQFNR